MKKSVTLTIKNGVSPKRIGAIHINMGEECMLVYDKETCIGIVWEHQDSHLNVPSIKQAEIRFFEEYRDYYGLWHRMFSLERQRVMYNDLRLALRQNNEYRYYAELRLKSSI